MHPVPPTRPQQVYRPGPQFITARPVAPQFTPVAPPPAQQRPSRQRKELTIAGAIIGGISLVIVIIVGTHSSSTPGYVSQLKSDGFTLGRQGTLTGGAGIGYAEGDNATGAGELVVQAKSAADARATANGLQGDGFDVTTEGDMLVIQSGSYTNIQNLVAGNGW